MDVEDAQNEVSVSSVSLNSSGSQQNEVLSPEDLAWVDSCLIKDSDISEITWIPMQNALFEIISAQTQSFGTDREEIEILPPIISLEHNQESLTYDVEHSSKPPSAYVSPLSLAEEISTDETLDIEKTGTLPPLTFQGNPFLPTYNEDLKENETEDIGLNLDSSAYEVEHTPEKIFKIWDLDIPSEEVELVKQLEKALSENSFQTVPSSFDDLGKLKEGSLDDLIGGIADLSLNNKFLIRFGGSVKEAGHSKSVLGLGCEEHDNSFAGLGAFVVMISAWYIRIIHHNIPWWHLPSQLALV